MPIDEWAKSEFAEYDSGNQGASYAAVMHKLFPLPANRQREIERLVTGRDPGFGYAVFAQLLANAEFGSRCNLVLTTNFDDLIADALYLYTRKKPLVIVHESLAAFAESGIARPLVVKLHGDAMLSPMNLDDETAALAESLRQALERQLEQRRGIIFCGYSGNDVGVGRLFASLPDDVLHHGVYWVNKRIPEGALGEWLRRHPYAFHVPHVSWEELMVLTRDAFDLAHPTGDRFDGLLAAYREDFQSLSSALTAAPATSAILKEAVETAVEASTGWWQVVLRANAVQERDPDAAQAILEEGATRFPRSVEMFGTYALFLENVRKDFDRAEEHYRRAMEADPNNAINLGNYATFLKNARKDFDRAEEHYRRALEADPNDAINLGNYAGFRLAVGRSAEGFDSLDKAEARATRPNEDALLLECAFYRFAHGPESSRPTVLAVACKLLAEGVRSEDFDLSMNVHRAAEDGHSQIDLVRDLAEAIGGRLPPAELDKHEAWRKTCGS